MLSVVDYRGGEPPLARVLTTQGLCSFSGRFSRSEPPPLLGFQNLPLDDYPVSTHNCIRRRTSHRTGSTKSGDYSVRVTILQLNRDIMFPIPLFPVAPRIVSLASNCLLSRMASVRFTIVFSTMRLRYCG